MLFLDFLTNLVLYHVALRVMVYSFLLETKSNKFFFFKGSCLHVCHPAIPDANKIVGTFRNSLALY